MIQQASFAVAVFEVIAKVNIMKFLSEFRLFHLKNINYTDV